MNDLSAITAAFHELARPLCLYARQWLDPDQAEEVVQDAFVSLIGQRQLPTNLKNWLYRTVRNGCIDRLRRKRTRQRATRQLQANHQPWFEPDPTRRLDAALVQQKLARQPLEEREVVTLRLWGQLSFREIAELTGRSLSTVHRSYRQTLDILRQQLETDHGTDNRI